MADIVMTPDQVLSWGPCAEYTIERLRELGEPSITLDEILQLNIPLKDKMWIVKMVLKDPSYTLTEEDRSSLESRLRFPRLVRD